MIRYIYTTMLLFLVSLAAAQETFSLEQAIDYALENHPSIKMKQLDIQTADSDIKEFKSIGMPKVNGTLNYQYYFKQPLQPVEDFISPAVYGVLFQEQVLQPRELGPPEVFEFTFVQPHNLNGGLEASALLFDGSYLVGLKAARLYKELIEKEVNQTEQDIATAVMQAYMGILILEENQIVLQKNIDNLEKSLDDMKAMFAEGFIESLDVDRLQLSYDNLQTELKKVKGLTDISFNVLKFQMNYPMDRNIGITDKIENLAAVYATENIDLDEAIDFSQRAEYDVIQTGQALNRLDLDRNKKGYLPTVRAFANASQSLQRTNLFDGSEAGLLPTVVAGLGVNIPIYDGGEKSAKIQKVKLNIEKTDLQLDEFKRGVTLQVRNAKLAMKNAITSIENTKRSLEITQSIYDKTQIKFSEGVGSSVEISQAEASLYQAQAAYISALYDLVTARTDLNIALGKQI